MVGVWGSHSCEEEEVFQSSEHIQKWVVHSRQVTPEACSEKKVMEEQCHLYDPYPNAVEKEGKVDAEGCAVLADDMELHDNLEYSNVMDMKRGLADSHMRD